MGIGSITGSNGSELTHYGSALGRFPVRAGNDNRCQFVDEASSSSKSGFPSLAQRRKFQVTYDPIDVTGRLFDLMPYRPSMTMRLCQQVFAVAIIFFATPSVAEPSYGSRFLQHVQNFKQHTATAKARRPETFSGPVIFVSNEAKQQEPDTDILALMSGKCSTLKIAGRDFACRAVAFFHGEQGRANFTIALDDPTDDRHIITFSGENSRREQDNLYELQIDRVLLNSKDRPKVDGLPVPFVELSAGICKQLGSFATRQVSSISCSATDKNGKKYELQFESDGSPMTVRKIRRSSPMVERRRAKHIEQLECRHKAELAKILPRDRTAYIIGCLEADSQKPTPAGDQ
jgi:hypothetical protein